MTLHTIALELFAAGHYVIPCDARKHPVAAAWRHTPNAPLSQSDAARAQALAIRCGGVECIDYDVHHDTGDDFGWVLDLIPEEVRSRVYIESTPRGGKHIIYRCETPHGNTVLARNTQGAPVWETRGEGGYVVTWPSPNYHMIQGTLLDLPTITDAERTALWDAIRSTDKYETFDRKRRVAERAASDASDELRGLSAFDDYAKRGDVLALLTDHGWQVTKKRGEVIYLRKPNDTERGHHATLHYVAHNVLKVFSTAAPIPAGCYSGTDVFTLLLHGGDYVAAGRALRAAGYGTQPTSRKTYDGLTPETILPYVQRGQEGFADLCLILHGGKVTDARTHAGRIIYTAGEWYWFGDGARRHTPEATTNRWHCDGQRANVVRGMLIDECVNTTLVAYWHYSEIAAKSPTPETAEEIGSAVKATDTLGKALHKLRDNNAYVSGIVQRYQSRVTIDELRWDDDPDVLAVANGVLSLRDYSLRPQRPDDYIRTVAPVTYDPTQPAPVWRRAIYQILGEETVDYLQRWLGYCLTGHMTEHVHPMLCGPEGRNGKDTILNALRSTLGPYTGHVAASVIMRGAHHRERAASPDVADLQGRRLCWLVETDEADKLNIAAVKELSGTQVLSARPLYSNYITFRNSAKIHIVTNNLPRANSDDAALWARVVVIEFLERFFSPDHPHYDAGNPRHHVADPMLSIKLAAETSGILNWLLEGHREYVRMGLGRPPQTVRDATQAYRASQDTLGAFIEEKCDLEPAGRQKSSVLYTAYREWCKDMGLSPMSVQGFGKALAARNLHWVKSSGVREWVGIRMKASPMWVQN